MIETLQNEFGIPGAVAVARGVNDLGKVVLTHESGAKAEVYLHGAHVTSWTDALGEELFFVSSKSRFAPGDPIRGGIPVVFPQFGGNGPLKQHGFARTSEWKLIGTGAQDSGVVFAEFQLTDSAETLAAWPHPFSFMMSVLLDAESLAVKSTVANTGDAPLEFQVAFHTYFGVGDIRQTAVEGLKSITFIDSLQNDQREIETRSVIEFDGEIDRIYEGAPDVILMQDRERERTIRIDKHNMPDAVVWNPWIVRARQLSDLGDDEYLRMLCIEAGCISPHRELASGGEWNGKVEFTVCQG